MSDWIADLPEVRGKIVPNSELSKITWLRVGGPADILFMPADEEDLAHFLRELPEEIPVFPIGVGSNLLVRDGGIRGVVIRLGPGCGKAASILAHELGHLMGAGHGVNDSVVASDGRGYGVRCGNGATIMHSSFPKHPLQRNIYYTISSCFSFAAPCDRVYCAFGARCRVDKDTNEGKCECEEKCSDTFTPVCGSDGATYTNECQLRATSCAAQKRIKVKWQGACSKWTLCLFKSSL